MSGRAYSAQVWQTAKAGQHSDGGNLEALSFPIYRIRKWVLRFTWRGAQPGNGSGRRQ